MSEKDNTEEVNEAATSYVIPDKPLTKEEIKARTRPGGSIQDIIEGKTEVPNERPTKPRKKKDTKPIARSEKTQISKGELIRKEISKRVKVNEKLGTLESVDTESMAKDVLVILGASRDIDPEDNFTKEEILDELRLFLNQDRKDDILGEMIERDGVEPYEEALMKDEEFVDVLKEEVDFTVAKSYGLLENGNVPWSKCQTAEC